MSELYTEKRPWGYYTILDQGKGYKVKKLVFDPGKRLSLQIHKHRTESWTIVEGEPLITCEDKVETYRKGECIKIPVEAKHRIANTTDKQIVIIEVQSGDYLEEDDIIRFEDDYQRV